MSLGPAQWSRFSICFMLAGIQPAFAADVDSDGVKDSEDYCCNTPTGAFVFANGVTRGDLDWDCDVDEKDAAYFLSDFGHSWSELTADLDGDKDADLADFWIFQSGYTGANYPGACCAEHAMAYGSSHEGAIEEYRSDGFCFEALAGDRVTVYLEIVSGGRQYLTLTGPDGAYFPSCGAECQLDCLPLPADGTYFINVGPWLGYLGGYRLHVTRCLGDEDPTIIPVNTTVEGQIAPVGERDTFEFSTEAGVPYRVEWTPQAEVGELSMVVYFLNGVTWNWCNAACNLDLPVTAEHVSYGIMVDAPGAAVAGYQLRVKTLD